jgi:hypothetical protein
LDEVLSDDSDAFDLDGDGHTRGGLDDGEGGEAEVGRSRVWSRRRRWFRFRV